jgi:YbgC/YbaW family acyl-CoA thioester hydrolase
MRNRPPLSVKDKIAVQSVADLPTSLIALNDWNRRLLEPKESAMIFEYRKRIYGHLNNANYLQLLEAARAEALIDMEMSIARMRELDLQIFVTAFELRYIKAIQLEDIVTVKTWATSITRLRGHWRQEVYDGTGTLCFTAEMDAVFARGGKPQRLVPEVLEIFVSKIEP